MDLVKLKIAHSLKGKIIGFINDNRKKLFIVIAIGSVLYTLYKLYQIHHVQIPPQIIKMTEKIIKQKGCCKGQTGHHISPDSFIENEENGKQYEHSQALKVCVEETEIQ